MFDDRGDAAKAFLIGADGAGDALHQFALRGGEGLADALAEGGVSHAQPRRQLALSLAVVPGIDDGAASGRRSIPRTVRGSAPRPVSAPASAALPVQRLAGAGVKVPPAASVPRRRPHAGNCAGLPGRREVRFLRIPDTRHLFHSSTWQILQVFISGPESSGYCNAESMRKRLTKGARAGDCTNRTDGRKMATPFPIQVKVSLGTR